MIGNLFDSPWKILLVAVVLIVLFGSKKLPHAARSLGQSMRILKREVRSLHDDENESPAQDGTSAPQFPQAQRTAAPSQSAQGAQGATAPADQQSQIDALQQQIRDLQRSAATDTPVGPGSAAEPQGPSSPAKLGFLLDSVMAKLPGATQDARIVGERYVRSQRRANLEKWMPLFDHLRELRNRVVKMA